MVHAFRVYFKKNYREIITVGGIGLLVASVGYFWLDNITTLFFLPLPSNRVTLDSEPKCVHPVFNSTDRK